MGNTSAQMEKKIVRPPTMQSLYVYKRYLRGSSDDDLERLIRFDGVRASTVPKKKKRGQSGYIPSTKPKITRSQSSSHSDPAPARVSPNQACATDKRHHPSFVPCTTNETSLGPPLSSPLLSSPLLSSPLSSAQPSPSRSRRRATNAASKPRRRCRMRGGEEESNLQTVAATPIATTPLNLRIHPL